MFQPCLPQAGLKDTLISLSISSPEAQIAHRERKTAIIQEFKILLVLGGNRGGGKAACETWGSLDLVLVQALLTHISSSCSQQQHLHHAAIYLLLIPSPPRLF